MADDVATEALEVELCTHEKPARTLEATEVILPGEAGVLAIRPGHTPLLTTLTEGVLIVLETNGEELHYAVGQGFAEIANNRVLILTHSAEHHDEIDLARAEQAKERAEAVLRKPSEDADLERAELALRRALARIDAHGKQGY